MQQIPLLDTRPKGRDSDLLRFMTPRVARCLQTIACPLIAIEPLAGAADLDPDETALFTSVNGVRFAPEARSRAAICVGARTTQAARDEGWQATLGGRTGRELIDALLKNPARARLHHLSGVHHREDIVETLCAAGMRARRTAIYDQILLPLTDHAATALASQDPVLVPVFSPRAAEHFAVSTPSTPNVHVIAISEAAAQPLIDRSWANVTISAEPTAKAVAESVENVARALGLG